MTMKKNNLWKWGVAVVAVYVFTFKAYAETVNVKVRVLDQNGDPVVGVKIDCDSHMALRRKQDERHKNLVQTTNEKGTAMIKSLKRAMSERVYLKKEGFYSTRSFTMVPLSKSYPPKDPIELTIKKIKNPIPMYAKEYISKSVRLPRYNGEKFGYDLMVGDWVMPYGKGKSADFIFQFDGLASSQPYGSLEHYDNKINVHFSNEKDGIIAYKALSEEGFRCGSGFVSDYRAPEEGYQAEWVQRTWKEKGSYHQTTKDMDRNFYFRVRTKVDAKGNIVSAHYGKIYGDFMRFIYYLNPTSNDRNVEFDRKKNLFKEEKVDRP